MAFLIWDRIKNGLKDKKEEKIQKAMTSFDEKVTKKVKEDSEKSFEKRQDDKDKDDKDTEYKYENENAQSWNSETHPEGRGDSYIVKAIHYNGKTKELIVEYRWGQTALYKNISKEFVERFNAADSKGRFAMKNLFDKPFEEVND